MKSKTKNVWKTEKQIQNENKKETLITFLNECEATEKEYNPWIGEEGKLFRVLSMPQSLGYSVEINEVIFRNTILIKIMEDGFHGDKLVLYTKDDVSYDTSEPWNSYVPIGEVKIEDMRRIMVQRKGMGFK